MASSAAAFGALSAPAAAPAYTCTPVSECRPCPADHVCRARALTTARVPLLPPVQQPPGGALCAHERHGARDARVERVWEVYRRRSARLWPVCGTRMPHAQFLNLVVVAAALSVYIWRQVYQTRKFRGMLYKRVHGRARVRPAL